MYWCCLFSYEKIKKEISWDEEERRDKEKNRLRATARRRRDTSSSSSSSSSSESEHSDSDGRSRQRKRTRRLCTHRQTCEEQDEGGLIGDGSETLYETEYPSEYDPSRVHSDPEESGHFTPPRSMVSRDAHTTPRVVRRYRRRSARIRARQLGKRLSNPIGNWANPDATQSEDEIVSGYDTVSGYHSGPGELTGRRSRSSESDTLEYIGTPPLTRSISPMEDILCTPPAIPSSLFDENLTVKVDYGEKGSPRLKESVGNPVSHDFNSQSPKQEKEEEADMCSVHGCSCNLTENVQANGWNDGPTDSNPASANAPCDGHVSVINNVYRDVTYISYGHCGHAASVNRPSCFHCCAAQSYDTCYPCHHSHYPCSHPSHYHPTHMYTSYMPTYKPDPHSNQVDPHFKPAVPTNNPGNPTYSKRKLDSEQSDPSCNGAAPLPKKQCC